MQPFVTRCTTFRTLALHTLLALTCCTLTHAQAFMLGPASSSEGQQLVEAGSLMHDGQGGVYIIGRYRHVIDFDPGPGEQLGPNFSRFDLSNIFVGHYDRTGALVDAFGLPSFGNDYGSALAPGPDGGFFITGHFSDEIDFDPGVGEWKRSSTNNRSDLYLAHYDAQNRPLFASNMSSAGDCEWGRGLAADGQGGVYLTGFFCEAINMDITGGSHRLTPAGEFDIVLARYGADGTLHFAHSLGSTGDDKGFAVAPDGQGGVYITGQFEDTIDFDPGDGEATRTSLGSTDAFLARYDADGTLHFAHALGADGIDNGSTILSDGQGGVYVAGSFSGTVDFDPGDGETTRTSQGSTDIFLARYDADGTLLSAFSFGGIGFDAPFSLAPDGQGGVYVTGSFAGTADFDPGDGEMPVTSHGSNDIFLARYAADGTLHFAHPFGGPASDVGRAVASDGQGGVYLGGTFLITIDLDPGAGEQRLDSQRTNTFVAHYDAAGNLAPVATTNEPAFDIPATFTLGPAYPNPFYPSTQFTLTVDRPQHITLTLHDVLGRQVQEVFAGMVLAGSSHIFTLEANDLPSGLYLYRATGPTATTTRSVVLLK